MADKREVIKVNKESIKDRIHIIRGQQVLLDSDLAMLYGYETRYLNLQVKHNINRFPEDFMFQLTKEEYHDLMLKNSTSSHGGRRSLPYVFTEQGVYQLATVLKGDLAERQSVAIMRAFRAMREYIAQNQQLLPQQELLRLSGKQALLEGEVRDIKEKMITKDDLSNLMKIFDGDVIAEELLIFDGQPFKADLAYQRIYRRAKNNIIVIDDYIGVKTLQHLVAAKKTVKITIITDNKGRQPLRQSEYDDFVAEYPGRDFAFVSANNKIHDRYIILDSGTKDMKVYLCGSSSKDSGKKITTIMQVKDTSEYKPMIKTLLNNPPLVLR